MITKILSDNLTYSQINSENPKFVFCTDRAEKVATGKTFQENLKALH